MAFNNRELAKFIGLGLVVLAFGIWLAVTGTTTGARPFTSPIVSRLFGILSIGGSMSLIVPGMWMLPRRRDAAIESRGSRVVLRAVAGRVRDLEWTDIRRVSHKPYAVDLRLGSGERVRVYGQVIDAGGKVSTEEIARFFAQQSERQGRPSS